MGQKVIVQCADYLVKVIWLYVPNIKTRHKNRFDAKQLNNCLPRATALNVHYRWHHFSAIKTPFITQRWTGTSSPLHHLSLSLFIMGSLCKFITGNITAFRNGALLFTLLCLAVRNGLRGWGQIAFF